MAPPSFFGARTGPTFLPQRLEVAIPWAKPPGPDVKAKSGHCANCELFSNMCGTEQISRRKGHTVMAAGVLHVGHLGLGGLLHATYKSLHQFTTLGCGHCCANRNHGRPQTASAGASLRSGPP